MLTTTRTSCCRTRFVLARLCITFFSSHPVILSIVIRVLVTVEKINMVCCEVAFYFIDCICVNTECGSGKIWDGFHRRCCGLALDLLWVKKKDLRDQKKDLRMNNKKNNGRVWCMFGPFSTNALFILAPIIYWFFLFAIKRKEVLWWSFQRASSASIDPWKIFPEIEAKNFFFV